MCIRDSAWTTMLSPQANDFTQETQIAKNDSRFVLFFCEIPLSNETKTYDINLMINGMPYHYRYEHTEIK